MFALIQQQAINILSNIISIYWKSFVKHFKFSQK